MTPQPPDHLPLRVVELAARMLPAAHRPRYMQEFTAELFDMPRFHQIRHAAHVLSRVWALRTALATLTPATIGDATMTDVAPRPLSCRFNVRHTWRVVSTEDGRSRYRRCIKCGKDKWDDDEDHGSKPAGLAAWY